MSRLTGLIVLLALGVGTGCTLDGLVAEGPAAKPGAAGGAAAEEARGRDYDPLIEGAEWTYRSTSGQSASEITTRIFNVAASGEGTSAETETITRPLEGGEGTTFRGQIKRLADRSESTDDASGVTTVFKLPLTVGRTWTSGTYVFKVEGEEAVTVPYGEFEDALRVTRRRGTSTTTLWMVDQVGTVKITGPAEGGGSVVMELVSFKQP